MKLPLIDYRQFRLSRLNTPQFRHLKLLLFWPIFSLVFCYLENLPPCRLLCPHALRAGSLDPLLQVVRHPLRVLVSFCRRDAALHLIL